MTDTWCRVRPYVSLESLIVPPPMLFYRLSVSLALLITMTVPFRVQRKNSENFVGEQDTREMNANPISTYDISPRICTRTA